MNIRDKGRLLLLLCLSPGPLAGAAQHLEIIPDVSSPPLLLGFGSGQNPVASAPDPAAIFHEGKEAMRSGHLSLAEENFRRVIALDPKSSAAHVNLGVAYMREKRWDDALVELHKAETLSPDEPGIRLNIGLAYYRKNDFAAAVEPFSAALHRAPESLQARYLLGLCYFFTNQYKEATDTLAP
ncbi:MAG TPA: tetratricopeptide repeat protein, partial [Silvibacterium sp.]|nr:tetratricopeptide repeat protein [Silvibacterium sp.]